MFFAKTVEGYIQDVVTYEAQGYIQIDNNTLPDDITNGYFVVVDNTAVIDEQKKENIKQNILYKQLDFDTEKLQDIKNRSKEMRLEFLTTENRLERQTAAGADTTLTQAMLDEIASKGDVIEQEMSAQMGYMMHKYNMTAQEVMGLLLQ